jgi:hypothetical protein
MQWFRRRGPRGVADLGIPPFPADGPPPAEVRVAPPEDPAAAYAKLGVDLPGEVILVGERRPGVPVWAIRTGEEAALDWWERLRSQHSRTGLWPVLFWWGDVPLDDAAVWETTAFGDYDNDDVMVDVEVTFDAGAWLTEHEEKEVRLANERRSVLPPADPAPADWRTCFIEVYGDRLPDALALIPAAGGWAVPAVLSWWGGANANMDPQHHSAVLRRWAAAYGAELVLLDSATMTLRAERPPTDDLALLRLAAEATVHCPYVSQGYGSPGTLEELAHLMRRPLWDFWWD